MGLELVLGRLQALLGLEPDETELILDVVNHDRLTLTTAAFLILTLSGGVSTLELEFLIRLLEVLAAVALVEDTVDLLDVVGVSEDLVVRDDILYKQKNVSNLRLYVCHVDTNPTVSIHATPDINSGVTSEERGTYLVNDHFELCDERKTSQQNKKR